ncbi:YVTN family beta-propeller protein [Flavobacterium sp. 7E]|uniref:YncE family protein n=1 Tax=unclassified Flavobacterium TaxID=196869 RepID=UPI001570DC1D|nr:MULTISPECIES: DUF5074 domain-containing protein [unclassified Flavobacterium]NRS89359.1 YVTN family beta-propeller protein [Flavobacterium sp. 7E]NRT15357.1 YVTN family beta-propeller protein [Flavobacterium sp. 28A]
MKLKNLYLGILASAFLFTSCSNNDSDDNNPAGVYDNGVFILNEGNFGTPNASVSFLSNDLSVFQDDIFNAVNTTAVLGDVAQSMSFFGDKAFIVVNNSNEVRVVNRYTFENLGVITEKLENPRYSVVLEGKLYVTNAISKAVTVYNANTYEYIASIALDKTDERIVAANGKLYVMNGAYGSGNQVTVINPLTNTVATTITVEEGINSIEAAGNMVYVLCGNSDKSKLFKINTTTDVATSFESTTLKDSYNMDIDGSKIYYTSGVGVYVMDLNAASFSETALLTVADNNYSTFYGFAAIDGRIYTADASGFTADGVVTVYNDKGVVLKSVNVGRGPNGFYDNN